MKNIRKYLSEFIGTAVLVMMGCGTAMLVGCKSNTGCGYILTAFAFGLSLVALIYCLGDISGCHVNPAVSIAMFINKQISGKDCFWYIVFQFIGAIAGVGILSAIWNLGNLQDLTSSFASNTIDTVGLSASILVEVILTFVFVLAVLGSLSKDCKCTCALSIGLSLTLVHILGIGLTGTSVNPARSFAPALFASFWGNPDSMNCVWVFILAPVLGGILAGYVYALLKGKKTTK